MINFIFLCISCSHVQNHPKKYVDTIHLLCYVTSNVTRTTYRLDSISICEYIYVSGLFCVYIRHSYVK